MLQMNHNRLYRDVAYALVAALCALLSISIANAYIWPLVIDIGGRDARFAHGFHDPETDASATIRFRWSDGDSTIALPRPPALNPSILTLRLPNGRPADMPSPHITLTINGGELTSFVVPDYRPRRCHLIIPPDERLDWALRIGIISDTITPPTDARALGVVVDSVALTPVRAPVTLPSLWTAICALMIGALGFALLRVVGLTSRVALTASVILALPIAASIALRPLETLPFVQRFAVILLIGCVGVILLRILVPFAPECERHVPAIPGVWLPVAMAIAWWMMPLFQLAMRWDEAPRVGLASQTLWIGAVLAGALVLAGSGWYGARGRSLPAMSVARDLAPLVLDSLRARCIRAPDLQRLVCLHPPGARLLDPVPRCA
jgi:hypothetical protein